MKPAQAKRLGYDWEISCRDFLIDEYPDVERNGTRYGPKDRGDLGSVTDWTLQCKNTKVDQWAKWFAATHIQSVNNKTRWWAVVRKARGRGTSEAIFCMPFRKGKELMTHLRNLEAENEKLKERIKELEND
jgi:hypothetical protein